jgi:hypothetical protein
MAARDLYIGTAVSRALGDGAPRTLKLAVRSELVALWTDLDQAIKNAIDHTWSMQCDWVVERIAILTRLTGHQVSQDEIPESFPGDVYRRITQAIQSG